LWGKGLFNLKGSFVPQHSAQCMTGYDAVWTYRWVSTSQRNILPPSSVFT
jgi:hypothetical protein